jgi:UDPglucose 6-dehydrogenase
MKELFPEHPARILYCDSPYQAAAGVNALLIITEWKEFLDLDLKKIKDVMANPIIIDGRNIYDAERVKKLGFEYYSVGRK